MSKMGTKMGIPKTIKNGSKQSQNCRKQSQNYHCGGRETLQSAAEGGVMVISGLFSNFLGLFWINF